jgi:hypothetical protein
LATADTRRLREIEARLVAIEGALADAGAKTLAEAQRLRNGLEARLVAVESKSPHPLTFADAYQGDYLPRRSYARGAIVRHARGLWLALEDTDAVPGGAAAWRLLLKGAA